MSRSGHLVRRFFASLWPGGPAAISEDWALGYLLAGEADLWRRMSGPDRRHAVTVARRVNDRLGGANRSVLAAALLHDVGKIDSGLGTLARVAATLAAMVGGDRVRYSDGRIGRYLRHPQIGADLLTAAGSDELTVAWAAQHHLSADRRTVHQATAEVLNAADDD
ncbi:MAG: HD domain-containing protein [Acidimicrobiales bacterium]|nr:HD domain-containing protein [Acidimicrobiales bacterium]